MCIIVLFNLSFSVVMFSFTHITDVVVQVLVLLCLWLNREKLQAEPRVKLALMV